MADQEWLFMLYLSGDNNLSSEMIWALKEIEEQGLPPGFEMTILYDALSPCCPTYVYDFSGQTKKGPEGAKGLKSSAITPLPLINKKSRVYQWVDDSSNPDTVRRFIEWSVVERPSKHRMLILSGHGSGAVGDFLPDDHAGNGQHGSLTIPALHAALDNTQKTLRSSGHLRYNAKLLDVLGMDSCLMSMAEVGYQVRNSVEYLVGSEGFVQNAGWPYGFLLKRLRERVPPAGGEVTPKLMAQYIVEDYIAYYREYLAAGVSVDMAGCELAKLGQPNETGESRTLRSTVETLTGLLVKGLKDLQPETTSRSKKTLVRDMVILAHWRAQSYKFEQYTDLWDFCQQLRELGGSSDDLCLSEIAEAAEYVQEAIDDSVGRKIGTANRQDYEGIEFQHSHGLSVYFPWSSGALLEADREAYQRLAFGADSGWGTFLVEYLDKTRREPRRNEGPELPIFGLDSEDARKKQESTVHADHRNAPNSGRNAPNSGRNAPNSGRNAPNSGRMLELLFDTLHASMKNPPQSVYLRPVGVPVHT
jgi:hypothetical protein